ncbi:MAG TPA: MFS transporter [Streptosporangiaceae bacterium]|nr:MFS transporter [Streptosporangiaceae bacterium]
MDSTVVAVALPAIGRNLHAGFQDLQWTVTSYTLTLASLILLAGSLSDRWGRRVFLAGLGWFTLASVLCAAAQGIGGALMTPASLAIIEAAFQPGDRTRAIGTWAGFSGVSSAIAPFLGGWLLQAGSWRAIFLINVPVAAVAAWTTRRHVPESRDTSLSGSADRPGALSPNRQRPDMLSRGRQPQRDVQHVTATVQDRIDVLAALPRPASCWLPGRVCRAIVLDAPRLLCCACGPAPFSS